MSIYLATDSGEGVHIASNGGWSDFGGWVETLDAGTYDQLIVLWEYGQSDEPKKLVKEIAKALKERPPHETISAIAASIQQMATGAEIVLVTNGVGQDSDGQTQAE